MTRMTGPDCVVMCNLINTYIHTYILHTYILTYINKYMYIIYIQRIAKQGLDRHGVPTTSSINST